MKLPSDKKYLHWGLTAFAVIAASIILFMTFHRLDVVTEGIRKVIKILSPITYGLIMAYVLTPLVNVLDKKVFLPVFNKIIKKKNYVNSFTRAFSIIIAWAVVCVVVVFLFNLVVPELYKSLEQLILTMPANINKGIAHISHLLSKNPEIVDYLNSFATGFLSDFTDLTSKLKEILPNINLFITGLSTGIMGVVKTILNVFIGVIVSIYVLKDKEKFIAQSKKLVCSIYSPKTSNKIFSITRLTHEKFGKFIVGKIFDSAIIGVLCFITVSIFRIPYSALISVVVGVTNVIPFFGPFLGAIPCALLILLVDPMKFITFVIIIIIIQQLDGNVIGPKILGDSIGISGFWVIFSILLGSGLFGVWGMICSIPVFGVLYSIIRSSCNKSLNVKGMNFTDEEFIQIDKLDEETGKPI